MNQILKKFIGVTLIVVIGLMLRSFILREPSSDIPYTVTREDLVDTVQVSGIYRVGMQKEVISTATGVVTQVFVENGQQVAEGDELFHVESSATEEEQADALSMLLKAQSDYNTAKANEKSLQADMFGQWDSFKELAESDEYENEDGTPRYNERGVAEFHIAEKDWLAAEAKYNNQQTVVSQTATALRSADLAYKATQDITITAPVSGTIVNLLKQVGDEVLSESGVGQNMKPAETVLLITNTSNNHVELDLNEMYVSRLRPNLPATIVFDAFPKESYQGVVGPIETIGNRGNGLVNYKSRVFLDNIGENVLPEMTVVATIETSKLENVLTIPNSALIISDEGYQVKVLGTNRRDTEIVSVEIGIEGLTKTQITTGLEEGAVVSINPQEN